MNKIYKVIWSKVKHQYVVVSELAHSNGKQSRTSRNSIRSRIAALVVCGAITAFGVYGALPMDSAFAAESYQYIAFKDDGSYGNKKSIEIGPNYYTKYTYLKTSVENPQTGKTEYYWVRQGYSIKLEENIRFDQDDIQDATTNTVINARKTSDSANDGDLILSYQNVQKDMKMNTLNGEKLNSTSTSIYGGGVNTSTVGVGNNSNYIIQRGDKYVDVGGSTDNLYSNFVRVNDGSGKLTYEDGVYKFNGEEVKTENLYVITNGRNDEVGVFTTTENGNTLYTGDVYGRNNEILMTGIDDDGNLVSYWGTEVRDNKATVGNMKIETLQGKFDEVDNSIKKIHKDDIKQIQVASATNGGTIGLQTNGEFNEDGTAKGGANVPGTITVTSEGGTNGSGKANDVKIKFASENGGSFTVDAGSKVEGLNSEGTATAGDTLTGIKINGEEYKLGGGKTYSPGQGIAISDDNKISVDNGAGLEFTSTNDNAELKVKANKDKGITVDGSGVAVNAGDGLAFETQEGENKGQLKVNVGDGLSIDSDSGKLVNNLKVTEAIEIENDPNKAHSDGGNWKIEDSAQPDIEFKNTTLVSKEITPTPSGYENTYTISDTDGNTVTLKDVASATKLQSIDTIKIGDLKYNSVNNENNTINNDDSVTTAIGKLDNKVNGGWNAVVDDEKINVTPEGNKNTLKFEAGNNVSITPDVDNNKITIATDLSNLSADETNAVLYDKDTNKTSVTLGGAKTYEKGKENTGVKLTNVAYANVNDESAGSDAVNVDLLKDYVDTNGGGSWNLTTSQDLDKESEEAKSTTVGKDSTVDFAGVTDGEHQNIHVTQETQYTDGKVTGTDVKFDLDDKLVLGDNDQITIDGSNGSATIGGVNITTTTTDGNTSSTIDGLTNNTWDNNNTNQYNDSKKAATEGQLYDALTGLSKDVDVAVVHADNNGNKDANSDNLKDTKATIWDERGDKATEKSSSIALGKDAFVSVQDGYKSQGILFGNETYTGGIAIGQEATALNGTVNIGVKDYKGQMGDVTISSNSSSGAGSNEAYNTYPASGTGETSVGSNSYISGMLSTNTGSYNIVSTKYMNTDPERILGRDVSSLYALQNTGAVVMGTLNSIESNTSKDNAISIATNIVFSGNDDSVSAKISGVANNVVGMANKTNNTNGSLIFGTGNEITNSLDDIPLPDSVIESIKNEILSNHGGTITQENASEIAEEFRKAVADRKNQNGGAVLAIGGGNKADYVLNSQLIGVQNQITGTEGNESEYNMVNGYQNTVTNGSNDTVIGVKNTVTGDSNIVLGDKHTVSGTNNIILGSSGKETTHDVSNTVTIGSGAQALTDSSVAVGSNAQVSANNSVAIGNGSVADKIGGILTTEGIEAPNYAGLNPVGTVSVGNENEKRTITNVAAGRINEDSTDAVNGSQLYATNQNVTNLTTKVDAGWSLYSNGKEVKNVKPGNNLVNIDSGENVSITKNEDGNGITISADLKDLDVEDTNAVLYDNEGKTSVTLGGTGHEAVKLTNVAAGALTETSTDAVNGSQLFETNTKVDAGWSLYSNGKEVKNVKPGNNWISIDSGDNVSITKNEDGNGIKISADLKDLDVEDTNAVLYDDEGKTTVTLGGEGHEAVKLTNVAAGTVNATSTDAINGSQLYEVQQQAGKHTTVTVNGGMTAPEDGSYTHDEEGRLDGNLLLKKTDNNGQTEYDLKLNPDLTLQGEDGSTARVEIGGTNGTIMATKDPNSMTATTTIDGGNVYVGSSVSVGDKVVMTNKDITGLSNTTWDGTTDDVSRAATEGQLQAVSNEAGKHTTVTVNGGMTAPEDGSYTHDEEGRLDGNLLLKKTDNNGQTEYDLKLNPDLTLQGEDGSTARVEIGGTNGTIMATKDPNSMTATTTIDGGNVYVGSSVSVGDKVEITDKDITGLSNTSWNGTTDDESRAATEGQLKDVSDTVNAGWTATDSNGASIVVNPENGSTLNFAGDRNIEVKANEKDGSIDVSLDDDMVLGGKEGTSRVEIGGTNGTIMATKDPNSMAATTTIDGGNVYVGSSISVGDKVEITDKDITGLSNTEWNGTTTTPDRAATEGQLQQVSNDVNAGWIATDNNGSQVNITPDNNKLNFAGDENVTVTAANNEIKVALKDDIVLGDYLNGDDGVLIGGSSGTISATNSITVGEDQGLIIDGQKKEIQGLSNTTWNEKIANDAAVEGSTAASTAATQGQLQEVSKVANAGWTASDGTNSISVKPNETLTFVGDENLTVSADGTDKELKVSLNDDITLKGDSSSIELTGTKGTIQVNQETAEGTNFTNINGNVVSIGYTNSEGIENAIVIDGGKGTITGLSNTTWDDELAKQVANSEELQGTAATQGQLQQAVSAVATEAAKQHTTVSGDDNLTVTSKENTNGGTNYQVTLNDDITLGNPKAGNTEGERSFTINTTDPNGYVPESYKTGSGANFIEENGGFMLFATDTRGFGVFGVTAKGSAWAKDFKTYTTDIYGNNTQYSLNEIGDAVAQMSSYYNEENGKSYTVFSRYLNEAEKDNPFVTVDENATRDIPLALRDDGAVLIGATIKGEDFTDNGIRINGEIDDDGNNVATITGLENTTWTPPAPVATFANEGTETSRAATEAQLNDLYGTVVGYNVDTNGVNYGTVTLGGGRTSYDQDTHEGGTVLNNVAYASGTDGSEAVNVDYLKDAISDAAENGSISTSDQHLVANTETGSNGVYKPNDDGNVNLIVSDEKGNSSTITIGDVASKTELDSLKTNVGDLSYSKVQGDDVKDGDSVTDAIGKLDNKIDNITGTATDADNNTVTGGKINSDGTISLTQKDKDSIKLEGQLTDSGVVQEGTSFDKETGTITITSQDKYSGETSSVKVEGIASTEVVGATNKEDLATAYKDADKDGNATTEYITDSESMVEADVALDHAIQDVAGTSYANDMVLSNRIDSVEKRLGNVEERIDKVGAMAAAIANLRTMGFDPEAPTEIAIGVGQYKSETGIAIGVFHYPNQDFMLSASLSSSGDELMGGIGATWKLGRKSAAERAKDEEARHLEQAEEMKKLAQQEKVKAQAQRHAKLLAERQQASQKNA